MLTQLALFEEVAPRVTYYHPGDCRPERKTAHEWRQLGFCVAPEEKAWPVAYLLEWTGVQVPLYDFMQVDLMERVPTRLWNVRVEWMCNRV